MFRRIASLLIVAVMVGVLVLFQLGKIAAGDAFFIAGAIVVVFTGQQLLAREEMGYAEAARSIFTQPQTFRSRSLFAAYFACLGLSALITTQVLLGA